jgi:hypothetical protein
MNHNSVSSEAPLFNAPTLPKDCAPLPENWVYIGTRNNIRRLDNQTIFEYAAHSKTQGSGGGWKKRTDNVVLLRSNFHIAVPYDSPLHRIQLFHPEYKHLKDTSAESPVNKKTTMADDIGAMKMVIRDFRNKVQKLCDEAKLSIPSRNVIISLLSGENNEATYTLFAHKDSGAIVPCFDEYYKNEIALLNSLGFGALLQRVNGYAAVILVKLP